MAGDGVYLLNSREVESASGRKRPTRAELEAQHAELSASKEAAEKLAADLHVRILDLTARGTEMEQELRKTRLERDEAKALASSLEATLPALKEEAAALGRRFEDLQKAGEEAEKENLRLRSTVAPLEEAAGRARLRIEELERERAEVRRAPETPSVPKPPAPDPVEAKAAIPQPLPPPPAVPAAEAPPPPKAEGSTTVRTRRVAPTEAIQDSRNLFGPAGGDGKPAHVLLELLSQDSLGAVYRACERATGQFFAVRFMPGQAGEEQTAAIEREVELLMALPHPNILPVRGSGRRQSRLYITMDLVNAESLGQAKIREIPRLGAIFRDAADAVHYAHEERILHGDLNPGNILVGREGDRDHALVKDFGLGHLLEGTGAPAPAKQGGISIRLPAYLPPEQMKEMKGKLSVAADVYGLGAALYATLAGRAPFEGQDARQVCTRVMMEEPAPLERLRPDVPEALAAIVRRAMAKERSLRYGSAKEMAEALTRFLEGPMTRLRVRPPAPEERKE